MRDCDRVYPRRKDEWYICSYEWYDAPAPGKRRRERQKIRRKDSCKRDMESVELQWIVDEEE